MKGEESEATRPVIWSSDSPQLLKLTCIPHVLSECLFFEFWIIMEMLFIDNFMVLTDIGRVARSALMLGTKKRCCWA